MWEKMNKENYRQFAGYCLENKGFHVCGYERDHILVQAVKESYKQVKRMIYKNSKGLYFIHNNKRVYII